MRCFIVTQPSYIADQLVAAGSRITEADLNGSLPGSNLVETDERGSLLYPEDAARLIGVDFNLAPVQVAPVAPHAPNPTRPQALPPQPAGGVSLAGDRGYVPADGVESNESAAARVVRLRQELAAAEEAQRAIDALPDAPVAPVRRGSAPTTSTQEPGPLDGSVPDLEKHLETVNDAEELQRLRAAETGGKSRVSALAAIDNRIAELED